jgi:hypothetical protein
MGLNDYLTLSQYLLLAFLVQAAFQMILSRIGAQPFERVVLFLSILNGQIQFAIAPAWVHSGDFSGHLEYITYISTNYWLPPPTGWQTQHPPLYYVLSAALMRIGQLIGWHPLSFARLTSLILFNGAICFYLLLLRRVVPITWLRMVCLFLAVVWPSAAHFSVKVTDDVAVLFFSAAFVYYLVEWVANYEARWLQLAACCVAGALASKTTGILLVAVLLISVAMTWRKATAAGTRLICKKMILPSVLIVLALCASYGRVAYWRATHNEETNYFVNRHDDIHQAYDYVDNSPKHVFHFSPQTFVLVPFYSLDKRSISASYFFHTYTKSLLYEVVGGNHVDGGRYAIYINLFFLISIFVWLIGFSLDVLSKQATVQISALSIMIALATLMMLSARVVIPISNHGVARFVYFSSFVFIATLGSLLSTWIATRRRFAITAIGVVSLIGLSISCTIFSVTRWGWPLSFGNIVH